MLGYSVRIFIIFTFLLFIKCNLISQTIPSNRKPNWNEVGVIGGFPKIQNFKNILLNGGDSNGVISNSTALNSLISLVGGQMTVIFFPQGRYFFDTSINIPSNIILKGEGSDKTKFIFNNGGLSCFNIAGSISSFRSVSSGYNFGSKIINLNDTTGINTHDLVLLNQTNGTYDTVPATWAVDYVGQVLRVTNVTPSTLSFEQPIRINFLASLNPKLSLISTKQHVGFEGFHITRTETMSPTSATGHFFNFNYASKCWIRGVEMEKTAHSAVMMHACKNIEITGCYIHHAYNYDGSGTRGYGITFGQWTSDCLAENNITDYLRHAIMYKQGANGNVAGYNFHDRTYRNGSGECFFGIGCDIAGDISYHGHYPFANLTEGHIGRYISADQSWGPSGPLNTLFRNHTTSYLGFSVASGVVNSDFFNIIGNLVSNSGIWSINGNNHLVCSNNVNGSILNSYCTNSLEKSLYYADKPIWWLTSMSWPSTGSDISVASQTNPARHRFLNGSVKTFILNEISEIGHIRYNTTRQIFEGFNGRDWVSLQ